MKFVKSVVTAGLALALSVAAHATSSAQAWLENYYKNPQPAQLVANVYDLSQEGYFTTADQPAIAIGFFAAVFAQNPAKVDQWFAQFRDLPVADQRLLASALWQSGNAKGREQLVRLSNDSGLRSEVVRLAHQPATSLAQTPVRSSSSMNLQWGAFLATGSEQHVTSILTALGRGEPELTEATRYALAEHAAAHPRVLAICRDQLDRQPASVRTLLQATVQSVEAQKPTI